jgi:phospholipase C
MGAGAALGLAAVGCSDAPTSDDPDGNPLSDATLLAGIDTIVVLCMENRSFDHYLGSRLLAEGSNIDGLTGDESNPAPDGSRVPVFEMSEFVTQDIDHSWEACHGQWHSGANDGFVIQHAGPNQADPMGYHVRAQLPTTYQLADAFTVCDRWFASVMGPTWPNRYYLHGASSNGVMTNTRIPNFKNIWSSLESSGISSMNYFHDVAWAAGAYSRLHGASPIESFFESARAGTLPQYTLIDPQFFGPGANDDHPDHDPQLGQALIASIYAAMAQSPQWDRCLFVVTYDEHGGFFDHVPPPQITNDATPSFRQLGFRVPSLVAGPNVRAGATVSAQLDHVSILSTLTRRFNLDPLNDRVRTTPDLSLCLDPSRRRRRAPQLDAVEISRSALADRVHHPGDHVEIAAATDRHVPRRLDRRSESRAITERVLRYAERLGAVRLVD